MGRSALLVALLLAAPVRGETIDASLTTMVAGRQDPRDGRAYTVVPIYQWLTLSAGGIHAKYLDELKITVSGWGEVAFGTPRDGTWSGDLDVGFLDATLLSRRVNVRLGRQLVFMGAARALQLDGASLTVRIFKGIGVNAWGGAPVQPRFGTRIGDTAAGARLFWRPGWESELGLSFVHVMEAGRVEREDLGVDLRVRAHRTLALTGYALTSITELRLAEGSAGATWQPDRAFELRAEYRRTAPDLYLSRASILSVFSQESRDEAGGSLYWRPHARSRIYADYHAIIDDAGTGHSGGAKATLALGSNWETSLGAEFRVLHLWDKGYVQARMYAIHRFLPTVTMTLNADAYRLEQPISGQFFSFTGAATLGWDFKPGWRALVSAAGDVTPFVQQRFEGMAKLVYNHTFFVHQERK